MGSTQWWERKAASITRRFPFLDRTLLSQPLIGAVSMDAARYDHMALSERGYCKSSIFLDTAAVMIRTCS